MRGIFKWFFTRMSIMYGNRVAQTEQVHTNFFICYSILLEIDHFSLNWIDFHINEVDECQSSHAYVDLHGSCCALSNARLELHFHPVYMNVTTASGDFILFSLFKCLNSIHYKNSFDRLSVRLSNQSSPKTFEIFTSRFLNADIQLQIRHNNFLQLKPDSLESSATQR